MCVYVCVCMCVYVYVCMCMCVYVCVCMFMYVCVSVVFVIYNDMQCPLCPAPLYHISPQYLTNGTIFVQKLLNIKCVLIFSIICRKNFLF